MKQSKIDLRNVYCLFMLFKNSLTVISMFVLTFLWYIVKLPDEQMKMYKTVCCLTGQRCIDQHFITMSMSS